ncbi:MAG: T9SS type A sorting domain-containing protein [Flavobacteriales bacterium]
MNKFLLSFLLSSSLFSFAQDWQPFPLGQKSFYQVIKSDTSIHVFNCDKVINNGSTYLLSGTEENFQNCYNTIYSQQYYYPFNPYRETYKLIKPDSIDLFNDTLVFRYVDNYQGNNSIIFLPNCSLYFSWFSPINIYPQSYNRLKFTCDSVYIDTVIGSVIDSVKLISIEAYNNLTPVSSIFDNQKIILSKNNGYKQFVSFDHQNQYSIKLIGTETISTQQGFNFPNFNDYFHLNNGDVIIWKEYFNGDIANPTYTYYYKDSLIESFINIDSIYYKFNRQKAYGSSYLNIFSSSSEKLSWLANSTLIYKNFESVNAFTPYALHCLSPIYNTNNTYMREYYYDGLTLDSSNCILGGAACVGTIERYDTKVGLNYQSFTAYYTTEHNVIGSVINGTLEGVAWSTLVTGINDIENISDIKIYPNPSQSGYFVLESEQVKSVELLSIDGKTVFTQTINQPKTELRTGLPKGLYFAKITFENKKQVIQRLIVSE